MTSITGTAIPRFQLVVWRSAIKLEQLGMARKGKSCLSIVKEHFNLLKNTPTDLVLTRIEQELSATQ